MFKAIVVEKDEAGYRAGLKQVDDSALPPGDVTVRVEYSSLNFKDALAVTGRGAVVKTWPLVPGIDPPKELFELDRWRIVGLTMDPERLLKIRGQRVRGMGGFGTKDGYADLVRIYGELDEIGKV